MTIGHINAHTHIYSGLAPLGMPAPEPPPENFSQILERIWWRLDRALDSDSLRASARLYVAEARGHGTVGLIDHHESPNVIDGSLDIIADVCQELGMRAVLCYGATERNGGRDEARRGLEECRRFIAMNQRPLVRGVVGLHAAFTVSDDTIREAGELARELGTVLHVHVAEDQVDVQDAQSRGYAGVIDRFARLDALVPGSIFAHGVHLTADEVRRCAEAGCWLVQNPRSNQGNKVGYPQNLVASELVALGTDGYPSDMLAETNALRESAENASDNLEKASARAAASRRLFVELFGQGEGVLEPAPLADSHTGSDALDIDTIRTQAREQADRLWQRMKAL